MTYAEAVELIRQNTFNLQLVPADLVDLKMMRFARRRNIWAADAYCPKGLKKDWLYIILDHVAKFPFIEIDNEGWESKPEPWTKE